MNINVNGETQIALALTCLACYIASNVMERAGIPTGAVQTGLAVTAYLTGGALSTVSAVRSLAEFSLEIDSLMVIAALGAGAIGSWHEGAFLLFLFSLSNGLESLAMKRTRSAIGALVGLAPDTATVRRDGAETRVAIDALRPGDVVVVNPGERMPVDGTVQEGSSEIDAAMLTGESRWVARGPGDPVFAGTLNQTGVLVVGTTRPASETYLARVIGMVEAAQTTKAKLHRMVDGFGHVYTPVVLVGAMGSYLWLRYGTGMSLHDAFYRSTVLLVVASPCAVLLATPSAILSAIGHGARAGALFKGGVFVERLGEVKAAAFDKTGVLTSGVPKVHEITAVSGAENDLLRDAVSLEQHSTHPLAAAVTAAARDRKIAPAIVTGLTMHQGLGLSAMLDGGRLIWVGSEKFAGSVNAAIPPALLAAMEAHRTAGRMTVLVGQGGQVAGLIAIADVPRPGAAAAIAALRAGGIKPLVMMTGDHPTVGELLGRELGLDEVQAGLLPDEKLKAVTALTARAGPVVMVGDGVNDGPALAAAHVGVTLGMASEVALEVADVVLVTNDLSRLPYAIALARKARRVIVQNLVFASCVILCGIGLALSGSVTLPAGVILHEGSTLIVVANGLRLLRKLKT